MNTTNPIDSSEDDFFDEDELLATFIEVQFTEQDAFRKIRETLTRIGIPSTNQQSSPKLYQSCHILHKRGKYYIVHFKEMLQLDGYDTNFSADDLGRRNTIAFLLRDWGLLTIKNPENIGPEKAPLHTIRIVKYGDKEKWELIPKYHIGKKKLPSEESPE